MATGPEILKQFGSASISRRAIGISWFHEADYPEVLRIMEDAHVLPQTFAAWQAKAEKQLSDLETEGYKVYRAIIDPKSFTGWCAVRGLNINAKARTSFAAEYAARQLTAN